MDKNNISLENSPLMKPWQVIEALGIATGESLKHSQTSGFFLMAGHMSKHISPDDCVEHEVLHLGERDNISVTILSSEPWKPTWRKVSARNVVNGNNLVVGQEETYFQVLLTHNTQVSQKFWLSERVLKKFFWPNSELEQVYSG